MPELFIELLHKIVDKIGPFDPTRYQGRRRDRQPHSAVQSDGARTSDG
jgi:hypothetical protein